MRLRCESQVNRAGQWLRLTAPAIRALLSQASIGTHKRCARTPVRIRYQYRSRKRSAELLLHRDPRESPVGIGISELDLFRRHPANCQRRAASNSSSKD